MDKKKISANTGDKLYSEALKVAETQEALDLHQDICDEIHQLYKRKNTDYGDSFHKTFLEEGWAMARIRLSDKLNRFKTLSRGTPPSVVDETMRDTLIDLAGYAILTVMEIDRIGDQEDEE